ncbi:uncharacterized protein [Chelonus insularis]|uniref:uncharacterized protein isoform X1 n=1 Tax=Chelonus insularis TaxID=460826 RepID=UPI00158ACED5|nr:uncharacterized protein LOC118072664 isoform X1 [Chelonus insularis]
MRNIEIKAILRDADSVKINAKKLSGCEPTVLKQVDTFYFVPNGYLKLRVLSDNYGELIHYQRPKDEGPKLSNYTKISFTDKSALEAIDKILTDANGRVGVVEKTRLLYLVGQSRIHIDNVLNLGNYMEIEVVLEDHQDTKVGEEIANDLMSKLGINKDDLLANAYIDMLLQKP